MSYILDALAKADAERRHSSGTPVTAAVHQPTPKRAIGGRRWWAAAILLLSAAVAAWVWLQQSQPNAPVTPSHSDVPPATPPAPQAESIGTAETAAPAVAPAAPEPTSAPAPLPRGDAAPLPILAPVPPPPPVKQPTTVAKTPNGSPVNAAENAASNTPTLAASQPAAAEATAALTPGAATTNVALPRPPTGAPALTISGATYSDNPAHRLLIVNGKVVQEGQEVAPGVRLEAIGPRSAVFNQGGTRFNINHQ